MSRGSELYESTESAENLANHAIGVVSTGDDADAIAGTVLRAKREGCHTFLYPTAATSEETIEFARVLGATVLETDDGTGHGSSPTAHLTRSAREMGFPGLLYTDQPSARVDYEASFAKLATSEEYAIEAEPEPTVDPGTSLLVAVPAYNEERTIASVVYGARRHADEVLVVDDGSDDETVARAREAGASVIRHETNRGYGSALKTAFEEAHRAGVDQLVIVDGDDQHNPDDIPNLLDAQEESDAELVIGSRFVDTADTTLPRYRTVGIKVVNVLTNLSLGAVRLRSQVSDTQCGFRLYQQEAIETLAEDDGIGDDMGASTDILYHAHHRGYDIEEVGTTVNYEVDDANSQNPVSHGLHLVRNILRTIEREHPILILGVPGFALSLLGLLFGYWTISNYLTTGTFPIGLALTSAFVELIGIFACFTAIILHSLNQLFD